jgi:hypothetical protein
MRLLTSGLTAIFAVSLATATRAQTPAEFFKGKTIDLYIGTSAGGGYDAYGRLVARHLGRFLPGNPAIVAKNMTGGGGVRLANFLYNAAAKDGLAIATFNRGTGFAPLLGTSKTASQFDAARFNWVGSTNDEVSVCAAWHTTGITRYEQTLTKELVVGATGPAADTVQFPKIANGVLGTKFKIITGYPGGNDIDLAMERNEVQGRCGWSWSSVKATHPTWLPQKKINILFQLGLSKAPDLPDAPLIMDLAKTDEQRAIFKLMFGRQVMAWPYVLPPGVPNDRLVAFRKAFMETMRDKEFLADAAKRRFDIDPVSGEAIQKLVQEIYATPRAIVEKTKRLLQ